MSGSMTGNAGGMAGNAYPASLAPTNNLTDLTSASAARANIVPVTQRAPNGNDVTGYTPGSSIWIDPTGAMWQLDSVVNGKALWIPYAHPGNNPAALVSNVSVAYSTRRVVPSWTGNLFLVQRATDMATKTITTLPDGSPDVSTLAAFLTPSGGIGYVTTLYDQSGGGNNATAATLACAPKIDMLTVEGANVPLQFDGAKRAYDLGLNGQSFPLSWTSGTTVTFTSTPVPSYILPGVNITGTNIPANTTISAINYTTGVATLSNAPTAAPGAATVSLPQSVQMDIPVGATVAWQNWSTVLGARFGATNNFSFKPFIWGVQSTAAANGASAWAGIALNDQNYNISLRVINGGSSGSNSNITGNPPHMAPQVYCVAMGGTGGVNLTYQINGAQGYVPNQVNANAATTLTGGAIGGNLQWNFNGTGGGWVLYDFIGVSATIATTDMTAITASISAARGWYPQVVNGFTCDGSSTTIGNGVNSPFCWPYQVSTKLRQVSPQLPWNPANGGTSENAIGCFPIFGPGSVSAYPKALLIAHLGQGNSLQAAGTYTVTATNTATGVLTISGGTTNTNLIGVNVQVSGNVNMAAGSVVTACTTSTITVSPLPTGNVGTVTVLNDTAANLWSTFQQYVATAKAAGFQKIVLIGSASRGTFSGPQATEFATWKVFLQQAWTTLGVNGYIDLEDYPQFGSDGATMVVTSLTSSTVTVNALSAYAVVGSRVRWAAQPYAIASDTGGQTISGVSGTTLTLSGTTAGLAVGSVIQAVNPNPWTTYPLVWQADHQHFTPYGYQLQGAIFEQYLLANNILA